MNPFRIPSTFPNSGEHKLFAYELRGTRAPEPVLDLLLTGRIDVGVLDTSLRAPREYRLILTKLETSTASKMMSYRTARRTSYPDLHCRTASARSLSSLSYSRMAHPFFFSAGKALAENAVCCFYKAGSRVEILEEVRASHNSARIAIQACFYMGAMTLLVMSDRNP